MIKKYPYRFKTNDEMVRDYGTRWRDTSFPGFGWNKRMDYLLGKEYPILGQILCDIDGWAISRDMLTENKPTEPTYESKKNNKKL